MNGDKIGFRSCLWEWLDHGVNVTMGETNLREKTDNQWNNLKWEVPYVYGAVWRWVTIIPTWLIMRRYNQTRILQSCIHFVRWSYQRTFLHTKGNSFGKLLHQWYKNNHKVRLTVILWCLIANHRRRLSYQYLSQLRSDYREDKHLKRCHLWWLQCYQTSSSCLTELPDTFGIRSFSWCFECVLTMMGQFGGE